MGVDHLGAAGLQQEVEKLWRAIRRVSRATLNNASIGRDGIRVYDAGTIRFEDGGGIIILNSGYITIDGDITGAGDFTWTGPWNFTGPGEISGNLDVSGDIDLTGDINVATGGGIEVAGSEPIRLRQSGGLAKVEFGDAGDIWSGGDGITIAAATGGYINVYSGGVDIAGPVRIVGLPTVAQSAYPGSFPGAVVSDSSGNLRRVV